MVFATLQGASSYIHQQLSAERYPQSEIWGDPTFLDYKRFNIYPDDMSQEKSDPILNTIKMFFYTIRNAKKGKKLNPKP
jgi:hypothetical protein